MHRSRGFTGRSLPGVDGVAIGDEGRWQESRPPGDTRNFGTQRVRHAPSDIRVEVRRLPLGSSTNRPRLRRGAPARGTHVSSAASLPHPPWSRFGAAGAVPPAPTPPDGDRGVAGLSAPGFCHPAGRGGPSTAKRNRIVQPAPKVVSTKYAGHGAGRSSAIADVPGARGCGGTPRSRRAPLHASKNPFPTVHRTRLALEQRRGGSSRRTGRC
jgi:hypothetical protein